MCETPRVSLTCDLDSIIGQCGIRAWLGLTDCLRVRCDPKSAHKLELLCFSESYSIRYLPASQKFHLTCITH